MIYFDSAATALVRPQQVYEAVQAAMQGFGPARAGAHGPAEETLRCLGMARKAVAAFFGVADPVRVAFFPSATEALNTLLYALPGHVVTTAAEHQSVLRPLHRRGGYSVVPLDEKGRLDVIRIGAAVQQDTSALVVTHASNVTGNVYDLEELSGFCRRRGIRLIVDAAQTAGLLPIQVDALGLSAVCFSGHRGLLGPQGTGGVCFGEDFLPDPTIIGSDATGRPELDFPGTGPERYEAGTINMHGIAGLLAGIEHIRAEGVALHKQAGSLARRFIRRVSRIKGIQVYGDVSASTRVPIVSLNLPAMDCDALAGALWTRYEVVVSAGLHGAPLMHETLGTAQTGAVRFSFSGYNTPEEVDATASALTALAGGGRRRGRL